MQRSFLILSSALILLVFAAGCSDEKANDLEDRTLSIRELKQEMEKIALSTDQTPRMYTEVMFLEK